MGVIFAKNAKFFDRYTQLIACQIKGGADDVNGFYRRGGEGKKGGNLINDLRLTVEWTESKQNH